jgi:diguanylate cyclase (GGDEF)-like protein/PAS domain S-box-containing protein
MAAESTVGLKAELERWREIVTLNSDWIWEVDEAGRYTYSSPMGTELLGYPEEKILGRLLLDFMVPEDAARVGETYTSKMRRRERFSGLINRNLHANGSVVVLETSGIPIYRADGTFKGYRGIDRDVTELWARRLELETMVNMAPLAVYMVDREFRFAFVNREFARLCGKKTEELIGRRVDDFLPKEEASRLPNDFVVVGAGGLVPRRKLQWNGLEYRVIVGPVTDVSHKLVELGSALIDVTELVRTGQALAESRRRLEEYAGNDYLTGIYNRRYIDEILVRALRLATRDQQVVSVIMSDLDCFKAYNDHYGHQKGDACLKAVAQALKGVAKRPSDAVGRYGGEEFITVLPNTGFDGARNVAEKMRAAVEALAIPHERCPFNHVTMSFGVATMDPCSSVPEEGTDWERLVKEADTALYAAKAAGRNTVYPTE